jgi:cytochrome bd ubiquinol oxidase subunit I
MHETSQAARVLMGDSLGFHIIFVMMSLTLPILMSWFELRGIIKKDKRDLATARFWSKIAGLLVVTGVISGTIIAMQMSLVWPGILQFGGEVIGLPFMFETYAFLIEAVFLALYLTTWDKVKPIIHWIFGLFVVLGTSLSAFAITSVNAWMNYPSGFDYINGKIENVNVWAAMFSRTSIIEFVHSMPGYFLSATLVMASFYAIRLMRPKRYKLTQAKLDYEKRTLHRLLVFASFMIVLSGITGDLTGKYLAKYEPEKLASVELNYETRSNVPLILGGVGSEDGTISGPRVEIPYGLSILVGNVRDVEVQGINSIPKNERSPLVIHTFFNLKLTFIGIIVATLVSYFGLYYFRRQLVYKKIMLIGISFLSILAISVVELGWMITEIGRQPWAVRGYVLTKDAVTTSSSVLYFGYLFPLGFILLFIVTAFGLRKIIKHEGQLKGGAL